MYNQKDERNVSSRNFFVNRGLPERPGEEAPAQPSVQPASPSYIRTPMNNTMRGQQPPVYRQPYQQQYEQGRMQYQQQQAQEFARQQQYQQPAYEPQPQQYREPVQPQYQQQGYAQQPVRPAQQPAQPQYAARPQQPQQSADGDRELPTFVQRLFKKK